MSDHQKALTALFQEIKFNTHELIQILKSQPDFEQSAAIQPQRSGYKTAKKPFDPIQQHLIYYVKPLQVDVDENGETVIKLSRLDFNPQKRSLINSINDVWGFTSFDHRALNAHHRYIGYIVCTNMQSSIHDLVIKLNDVKNAFKELASSLYESKNKHFNTINAMLIENGIIEANENYEIITRRVRHSLLDVPIEKLTLNWKTTGESQKKKGNYQEALATFPEDPSQLTPKQVRLINEIHKHPTATFMTRFKQRPAPMISIKYKQSQSWEKAIPATTPLIIYCLDKNAEFRTELKPLHVELVGGEIIAKKKVTRRKKYRSIRLLGDDNWYATFPEEGLES